jgi:hypothetical protein
MHNTTDFAGPSTGSFRCGFVASKACQGDGNCPEYDQIAQLKEVVMHTHRPARYMWQLLLAALPAMVVAAPQAGSVAVDTLPRLAVPHFNFLTLVVADFDRAFAFYSQVLGMHERGRAQPSADFFEVVMGFDQQLLSTGISLAWRNGPPQVRGNGFELVEYRRIERH